jgi:hypothetical protein
LRNREAVENEYVAREVKLLAEEEMESYRKDKAPE